MTIPIKVEAEIREKVKAGLAPICAHCGVGGQLAGGQVGMITCKKCRGTFKSLKDAWRQAYEFARRRRAAALAHVK